MEEFKGNFKYGIKLLHSRIVSGYHMWCVIIVVILLVGCAPSLYSVDMKYVPATGFSPGRKRLHRPSL